MLSVSLEVPLRREFFIFDLLQVPMDISFDLGATVLAAAMLGPDLASDAHHCFFSKVGSMLALRALGLAAVICLAFCLGGVGLTIKDSRVSRELPRQS